MAKNLFRGRNTKRSFTEKLAEENRQLRADNERFRHALGRARDKIDQTQQLLRKQRQETEVLRQRPITLGTELVLPHHSYGSKILSHFLNLAKEIGFPSPKTALKIVFAGRDIDANVSSLDSIRV